MRLLVLASSAIIPLLSGAYLIDRSDLDTDKRVSSSNVIDMREKTRLSIDQLIKEDNLSPENSEAYPSQPQPQVTQSHSGTIPEISSPEISFQFMINACANQAGNANLRVGNSVIGIISAGTVVDLTGTVSGEWIEVSGEYWPTRADHPTTGTGWVHQCWLTPESMVIVEPEPQTEPLGLLSRRGGRSFRSASRPRKSYVQSTGELAGYVGRDLYDYALLYPRIAAYQSFWNFATDAGPSYSYLASIAQPSFQPRQVNAQVIEISPGVYQGRSSVEVGDNSSVYPGLDRIPPKLSERLGIVPGESLMPWQQTLLKGHL